MLPTTGFFKDIDCPCYDISCGRPYCHFRHRKRNQEPVDEPTAPQEESTEIPTYKPTPKSELANTKSHIPISYVPDLVIRTDRIVRTVPTFNLADRPTYKPTPISILASTNNSSASEYKPTSIKQFNEDEEKYEIGDIDLSTELEMIDELIRDSTLLKDNALSEKNRNKTSISPEKLKDKKHKSLADKSDKLDKKKIRKDEKKDTPKKDKHSSNSKTKHRDKEKEDDNKSKKENENREKKEGKKEKEREDDHRSRKNKDKDLNTNHKGKKDDEYKSKKGKDPADDNKSRKDKEKEVKSSEDVHKNTKDKEDCHKSKKEKDKKDDHKNRKDKDSEEVHKNTKEKEDGHRSRKDKDKKDDHKSKKDKEKDDDHRSRKEKEKVSSSNHSNKDKQRHKDCDKYSRDKEKTKNKSSNNSNENISHEKKSDRSKNNKEKRRSTEDRESTKKNKSRSSDKESHRDKNKTKDSSKYDDKKKQLDVNMEKEHYLITEDEIEFEEDTIEEECYKIFNEYKAPDINIDSEITPNDLIVEPYNPTAIGKKRVAYDKADQVHQKITHTKPNSIVNVAVMMSNRIKIARQAHGNNEQKNVVSDLRQQYLKRKSLTPIQPEQSSKVRKTVVKETKKEVVSTNIVDDILNGKSVNAVDDTNKCMVKPRSRIAPVQNVMSIQRAKAKLDEIARRKALSMKTLAQTVNKGSSRVAHIPDTSLSDIPDVLQAERSKLPVNVRTRYLTMLASECTKLYITKDDAYERALNEEVKCYERCSALVTYRNSAMLAVNRLRKEIQERESTGLGPIAEGESNNKTNDSPFQGKQFYETISCFILSEDDLFLHGYPREGAIAGKAIINTEHSRQVHNDQLEPNERICCRCHKMYIIDDDGFSLYNEECIYHPLRMRTLRGERTYLCCKSSSESGCAMSNTHVSEASAERLLDGYQSTLEPDREDDPRSHSIYALDCEMCYTTIGLELTRVTIVDTNLKTVYESLVKPLNPIIDYNTRFSGITKEQMDKTSTSILQVQANILHLCNSETILIGHSLESDMKALKIIHGTIIDTSVMFPHKFGLPHKRALRILASEHLKKIIQNDVSGHDSAEDAITCMELVIWKVKEDLKVKGVKY